MQPSGTGRSTRVSEVVKASRQTVYQALLDEDALATWLPPDNMTGQIHIFEPRVGGRFRLSLTYRDPADSPNGKGGKSSADTDTVEGRFVELVPDEKVVWVTEFESQESEFAGKMRITWSLVEAGGGTEVTVICDDIPSGIRLEDNEAGSRFSLEKLAAFVEHNANT